MNEKRKQYPSDVSDEECVFLDARGRIHVPYQEPDGTPVEIKIYERLRIEQQEPVVEKIEQAEKILPDVKETSEQKPRRTFRE